jgi:hypothetical protein
MKLADTDMILYPKKYVERIFIGFEDPLNKHLIKLAGLIFPLCNGSTSGLR